MMPKQKSALRQQMRERGTNLKLWCYMQGLNEADYHTVRSLSNGDLKGKSPKTRVGQIRAMLEAEGYVF